MYELMNLHSLLFAGHVECVLGNGNKYNVSLFSFDAEHVLEEKW